MLLNNQETLKKSKGNQKIPRDKWQWKQDNPKPMGCSKSSYKREVYSYRSLRQETTKKSQVNNLTLHLKELENEKQTKPKVSRRKEIIKIRAEINEIEMKKKQ